jgi:tRNA (cmo5U34)-methyltransferase
VGTDDAESALFDRDPGLSASYEQGPRWFVPGYDLSHALAAVLLRDQVGDRGRILVVGAGGGVELAKLAAACEGWSFVGADPSREMLEQARCKVETVGASDRVSLVQGYVEDAPRERFDAATAFLCLNFVPDDGRRLAALREIHARLAAGAPFLLINGCSDMASPRFDRDLRLYAAWARQNGAPAEAIAGAVRMQRESLFYVPRERDEALLAEAGFKGTRLFYCALWVHGWIATA